MTVALDEPYFCNRWRSVGGEIWIDPRFVTDHVGKKNYSGIYDKDGPK